MATLTKSLDPLPDTPRQLIYEKSTYEFKDKFDDVVVEHHPEMVALLSANEKAGKA